MITKANGLARTVIFGWHWLIVRGHVVSTANSSQDRTDINRIFLGCQVIVLWDRWKPSGRTSHSTPCLSTHTCMLRSQVWVHTNYLEYLLLFCHIHLSIFFPSWMVKACFWKEGNTSIIYRINVGEIYFLSFSKIVMLCLEKLYFIFCNNQISRYRVFLYFSLIIIQNSTISLLGKVWHSPLYILTPPHLWVKLCIVFEQIL